MEARGKQWYIGFEGQTMDLLPEEKAQSRVVWNESTAGISKREYLAAKALQGMLANPANHLSGEDMAMMALILADKLIEESQK